MEGASLVRWMGRTKDMSEKFDLFQKMTKFQNDGMVLQLSMLVPFIAFVKVPQNDTIPRKSYRFRRFFLKKFRNFFPINKVFCYVDFFLFFVIFYYFVILYKIVSYNVNSF